MAVLVKHGKRKLKVRILRLRCLNVTLDGIQQQILLKRCKVKLRKCKLQQNGKLYTIILIVLRYLCANWMEAIFGRILIIFPFHLVSRISKEV